MTNGYVRPGSIRDRERLKKSRTGLMGGVCSGRRRNTVPTEVPGTGWNRALRGSWEGHFLDQAAGPDSRNAGKNWRTPENVAAVCGTQVGAIP